ncbi:MAG: hypothetical protein A2W29_04785 [Gemmatimonadetes bacterium RBG_16_66_8]|nr:MAG: hypothetical protein A2W29_04785 [Gemmatimonadetes bacterium RBG_16_66_8]
MGSQGSTYSPTNPTHLRSAARGLTGVLALLAIFSAAFPVCSLADGEAVALPQTIAQPRATEQPSFRAMLATGANVAADLLRRSRSGGALVASAEPINLLAFKGTHNSYVCDGECGVFTCDLDSPLMGHPPYQQIDDFGAYEIELDWSVKRVNGMPQALVGHDGPGHGGTCWGRSLQDYLIDIRDHCRALAYRPLFIFFEKKPWGESDYQDVSAWQPILDDVLGSVFQSQTLMNSEQFRSLVDQIGRYPTMPELAGKIITFGEFDELTAAVHDQCTDLATVLKERDDDGKNIFRLDQYMTDWTFQFGVPPNPIMVDVASPESQVVSGLSNWDIPQCPNGDAPTGNIVRQQGTFLLPYSQVSRAVDRAAGIMHSGARDPRTAGYGWTVLIRAGTYAEGRQVLSVPVKLDRDPATPGRVTIR